jgi:hypothetical protein
MLISTDYIDKANLKQVGKSYISITGIRDELINPVDV